MAWLSRPALSQRNRESFGDEYGEAITDWLVGMEREQPRCWWPLLDPWASASSRKNLGWYGPDNKLLGYVDVGRGGHLPLMLSLSPPPPHTEYRYHLCLLDMRSGRWLSRRPLMLL
uniref:Uncharacterized protein n=1 Tax=Oryza barthii TaxID=65489 RepID=A0A0D3F490_9ORYZ